MPKLYEYLGIALFFYSNEHEPVHVHGRYQGRESKAEIHLENGTVQAVKIIPVRGKRPLPAPQLAQFRQFVSVHAEEIVNRWIDYFVYQRSIPFEIITKRAK